MGFKVYLDEPFYINSYTNLYVCRTGVIFKRFSICIKNDNVIKGYTILPADNFIMIKLRLSIYQYNSIIKSYNGKTSTNYNKYNFSKFKSFSDAKNFLNFIVVLIKLS